jgi:diadenosine tetraphosphate (Ap4A) HIT family hydrolase
MSECIFCKIVELGIIAENQYAFAIRDKFPVKPLHTLIIPKRHVVDIFETNSTEREAVHQLALICRDLIRQEDADVGGFNFGSNIGHVAGQKIMHAHIHLIPRRLGDLPPPPAR